MVKLQAFYIQRALMSQLKATYIDHMGDDLRICNAARISFNNTTSTLEDKDKKLIKYLADNEHMSPFEHCTLTVIIECPLYIRSQIHRHRTFSYNEVSRRYTSENLEFFIPETIRKQSKSNRQASDGILDIELANTAFDIMTTAHTSALIDYNKLIDLGVPREQARGILPQNLMTKFYQTGNLRNWIHFIKLRSDSHAQGEVRELAEQIKNILIEKFPKACKVLMNE